MTCPRCKGLGSYWSGHQGGMWLACEHDPPPPTTHDGLTILTERNWNMKSGYAATMNWMAWIDGQEEFGSGHGKTEAEAIEDIRERWEERD